MCCIHSFLGLHNSLLITIEANKKVADFLDITLDLRTAIYKPYKKPNRNLKYIHKQSIHPPSIIKNLPKSINNRLSTNSKNAQIFNEACPPYTEALNKNRYNSNLQFDKTCTDTLVRPLREVLGALPLRAFFSDFRFDRCFLVCGQVEKSCLRLFREGCV